MNRASLVILSLLFLGAASHAEDAAKVAYLLEVDLEAKEWDVMVSLDVDEAGALDFWIPRWTPGAYHIADYGKYAKDLTAADADGNALEVERKSDSHWVIQVADAGRVRIGYRGKSMSKPGMSMTLTVLDVESNRITDDYAYVTPASLLGYVPELIDRPITLQVSVPEGWHVATALEPAAAEDGIERTEVDPLYQAEDFYELEDSPLFFSPTLETREFEVNGIPHAVSVQGASDEKVESIARDCQAIAEAAARLMRGLPYERYHFLVGFVPGAMGAGLEHSSSTLILLPANAPRPMLHQVLAHEHFHVWSAERLHVAAIQRPDFRVPLETPSLWFNEGVTEYMGRHVLLHAGLLDQEEFLQRFANDLREGAPMGRMFGRKSWVDTSLEAAEWGNLMDVMAFAFRAYQVGPSVMLALDMEMRRASNGERGIIDTLRFLDLAFLQNDLPLPEGHIIDLFSGIAQTDLDDFHAEHIAGTEMPDLDTALEVIGYDVARYRVTEADEPTEDQLRARADFFGIP